MVELRRSTHETNPRSHLNAMLLVCIALDAFTLFWLYRGA